MIASWRNSKQTQYDDENKTPESPKLQKRAPITTDSEDEENSYRIRTGYRDFRKFYKKSEIKDPGTDTPVLSSDYLVSDSRCIYVNDFDVDGARRQSGLLSDEKSFNRREMLKYWFQKQNARVMDITKWFKVAISIPKLRRTANNQRENY